MLDEIEVVGGVALAPRCMVQLGVCGASVSAGCDGQINNPHARPDLRVSSKLRVLIWAVDLDAAAAERSRT